MKLQPVESSMIKAVGYYRRKLWVQFTSERVYEYNDVPRVKFDGLLSAPSKGKFFNYFIKSFYSYKEVE